MSKWVFKIIGILVIVNVAVFLWPTDNLPPAHVHPLKVDVKPQLLKLNKEVEEDYRAQQRAAAKAALAGSANPDSENDVELGSTVQCYRLGPFSLNSNFEIAQATLLNAGLEVDASTRAESRTEVYRLFLGPFANRAKAIDQRAVLNSKGILDHFIRNEPDGGAIVSLGIFSTAAAAAMASEQMKLRVEDVQLREEVVTLPQSYWLYFALNDQTAKREDLDLIDWGEVGAQIGPFQCRTSSE